MPCVLHENKSYNFLKCPLEKNEFKLRVGENIFILPLRLNESDMLGSNDSIGKWVCCSSWG